MRRLAYAFLLPFAAVEESEHHAHNFIIAIGIRLTILLATATFHLAYHRFGEKVIHLSVHRVNSLKLLASRFKLLPDALMIGILIVLELVKG